MVDSELLTHTAHRILVKDLEARGNVLSELHRLALLVLVGAMSDYVGQTLHGRKAVALPTGMGKTSAVVAFILAVEELGYDVPLSVATSKVEALCILKRELMARGVAEDRIGLKHRVPEASMPSTGDSDRRYMLVTHSRVNRGNDYELFGCHKGRSRPLMVWDESLMRSDAVGIDVRMLKAATGALEAYASTPELASCAAFVREGLSKAEDALAALRDEGDPQAVGVALMLAERSPLELDVYARAAGSTPVLRGYVEVVREFLAVSQEPLRVVAVGTSEGVIWSRECIPDLLRNVLVLDASHPIRSLVQLDPTIAEIETYPAEALKQFGDVRVVQFLAAGGRSSIMRSGRQKAQERSEVIAEVADVVDAEWTTSRGILVFTFKQSSRAEPDHQKDLRVALRARGLDPDQPVDTGETDHQGRPVMKAVGSSRVDLQACKLEYSIVSPK